MTHKECSIQGDGETPFVECSPIKTFGFLLPLGFRLLVFPSVGVGVLQLWSALPPLLPSGLYWDLLKRDTQGTHKPRPSLEGLPPATEGC